MRYAVLFDLDGVLVKTEGLKSRAHQDVVRNLGSSLPPDFYREVIGQSKDKVARRVLQEARLEIAIPAYNARFNARYRDLLSQSVEIVPGAVSVTRALRSDGYLLGVVSSSSESIVVDILSAVGLASTFDVVVTATDSVSPKPSPEPYVRALEALAVDPRSAVAFEDTEPGLTAARRAGLVVIVLRHPFNPLHDFTAAAAIIDDFRDNAAVISLVDSLLLRWPPRPDGAEQ